MSKQPSQHGGYSDSSKPKKPKPQAEPGPAFAAGALKTGGDEIPLLGIGATVLAALVGPLIWIGCDKWFGFQFIAGVLIGLLVGGVIRVTNKQRWPQLVFIGIGLTFLSAMAGYVINSMFFATWIMNGQVVESPGVGGSIVFFLKNVQALLFTAIGMYGVWLIGRPLSQQ